MRPREVHPRIEALETRVLLSSSPTVQLSLEVQPAQEVSGTPQHLSPAMIEQAYDLNNLVFETGGHTVAADGAGETIAIVDAYTDPNITSDLSTFDSNFGLSDDDAEGQPALTIATPQGTPAVNAGWSTEQSLDVEWAHAIAPGANILLVETPTDTVSSLTSAVVWAASQPDVVAVSMSWGDSPEFSGETSYDHDFTTPSGHGGVTFVAASGDDALPNYPSTSPNVLAVGGTTLTVDDSGDWISESAWSDSGGGDSPYERTIKPDVAYDGNPSTGFIVYDSVAYQGNVNWQVVGGTSAGSPQWAAIVAVVDQGRSLLSLGSLDGATQTIPDIYALPSTDFNVVTGGGLTGLGSPIGEKVISALVGGGITGVGSSPGVPSQVVFDQQPTNVVAGVDITPPITVDVEDSDGNLVILDNSEVTLSVGSGPGSISGTLQIQASGGVATFSDISFNTPGTYTLDATDGSLVGTGSTGFTVSAPQLVFSQEPTDGLIDTTISPPITVAIEDSQGDVLSGADSTLTLSIANGPSGAVLGGTLSVAAVNGVATFSDISVNVPGNYTLAVADGAVASGTSSSFTAATPHLVFTQQPAVAFMGIPISPAITVSFEDPSGQVVITDNSTVTLSILSGPAGATLGGTLSVTAASGVATFSDITLNTAGAYTLSASDGAYTSAIFASFTVDNPGWVDTANMDVISGWAYDPTNPTASANVEIAITGGPTQIFSADETRSDLQPVLGSTNHGFTYSTPVLSVGSHTAYIYVVEGNGAKVLLGTKTLVSQNSLFDEHYYLTEYPNVAAAVAKGEFATGYDHYIEYGQYEGYSPSPYWDEAWYLQENPDVAAAVKAGKVSSGFMQYYLYGQYENRPGLLYFNTSYYLENYANVAAAVRAGAVTSAFEHFVLYGQYEGYSPMLYFSSAVYDADNQDILPYITGEIFSSDFEQFVEYGQYEDRIASNYYNEQIYLADNPDVAAAVEAGKFADGFQHWLMYGQYEGRTAV
jgi:hypothetical protein